MSKPEHKTGDDLAPGEDEDRSPQAIAREVRG